MTSSGVSSNSPAPDNGEVKEASSHQEQSAVSIKPAAAAKVAQQAQSTSTPTSSQPAKPAAASATRPPVTSSTKPRASTPGVATGTTKTASREGGASTTKAPVARKPTTAGAAAGHAAKSKAPQKQVPAPKKHSHAVLIGGGVAAALGLGLVSWALSRLLRKPKQAAVRSASDTSVAGKAKGPCSNVKPTSKCVPLADGSACVVRRTIPADNSCLFNSIGYCMHASKSKANFLRGVVAREVSSDPENYTAAFLGMPNGTYCQWITAPHNWGGGIELAILAKHYGREIAAWNIETVKSHVFGEESGYTKMVCLIYTGTHYDALAISPHPKSKECDDTTEFNPRTKRGKMILAAAEKLVELAHRNSPFFSGRTPNNKLRCSDCKTLCASQAAAVKHSQSTGHTNFEEVKKK